MPTPCPAHRATLRVTPAPAATCTRTACGSRLFPLQAGFHAIFSADGIIGAEPYGEMSVGVAWRVGIIAVRLIDSSDTLKVRGAVQAFQYLNYLKNVEHQNSAPSAGPSSVSRNRSMASGSPARRG